MVTGRGGVGKTTVTSNLGVALCKLDFSTVVVDGDIHLPNLGFHFKLEMAENNLHKVLNGEIALEHSFYDHPSGVVVIPGSSIIDESLTVSTKRLPSIIESLSSQFDFVLIDAPPGIPLPIIEILPSCDAQLIVVELGRFPLVTIEELRKIGNAAKMTNFVVVNKYDGSEQMLKSFIAQIDDYLPIMGIIPYDKKISSSIRLGVPYLYSNPKTHVSRCFIQLAEEITKWRHGVKIRKLVG